MHEPTIGDRDALEAHFGAPMARIKDKELARLDAHCRRFIAAAPIFFLATSAAGGGPADCSPRGGDAGFVRVLDDTTIVVPDRPGNKRVDSFHNIVENPQVALCFLVPGKNEVLRLNGRARLTTEPALLATLAEHGKLPLAALVIAVDAVYFHCGKAVIRARIWDPATHAAGRDLPRHAEVVGDQYGADVAATDALLAREYRDNLY